MLWVNIKYRSRASLFSMLLPYLKNVPLHADLFLFTQHFSIMYDLLYSTQELLLHQFGDHFVSDPLTSGCS